MRILIGRRAAATLATTLLGAHAAGEAVPGSRAARPTGGAAIDADAVFASGDGGPLSAPSAAVVTLPDGRAVRLVADEASAATLLGGGPVDSAFGRVLDAAGVDDGRFVLARSGDSVHGAVWTGAGAWEIRGAGRLDGAGEPVVRFVAVAGGLPSCELFGGGFDGGLGGELINPGLPPAALSGGATAADEDPAALRVTLAFGEDAVEALGGPDQIESYAASLVASANSAYANSQIPGFRMELASVVEVTVPWWLDTGPEYLYYATGRGDSIMDELHTVAGAVSADLTALIVDVNNFCGVGFIAPGDPELGFTVSDIDCALGNLTFAHEIGHNLGCHHAPEDTTSPGFTPYSFGHKWGDRAYRSIMAYSPGQRVPYYSNPDVSFGGSPTGVAGQRDNARVIREFYDLTTANRSGGPGDTADCDGDGVPDGVEIAAGSARDDDRDGVPDGCEIESGAETDCNRNGRIDSADFAPPVRYRTGPIGQPGGDGLVAFFTGKLPAPASDVTVTVAAYADLSAASEFYTVEIAGGSRVETVFVEGGTDCGPANDLAQIVIPRAEFDAMIDGGAAPNGVDFVFSISPEINPALCARGSYVAVSIDYAAADGGLDGDGDGVLDRCACYADIQTLHALPGGPGWDEPDGGVDGSDLARYVELYLNNDPRANMTTANTNPGDLGYGTPDNSVLPNDLSYYVEGWLAGCSGL